MATDGGQSGQADVGSNRPFITSNLFLAFLSVYGTGMLLVVFRSATVDEPLDLTLGSFLSVLNRYGDVLLVVLGTFVGLVLINRWMWTIQRAGDEPAGVVASAIRARAWIRDGSIVSILFAYTLPYFLTVPGAFSPLSAGASLNPLPIVTVIQGTILTVVVGVSSAPLLPPDLPPMRSSTLDERVDYLQLDMTQWWRWGQLAMSFFFAFGVGIAAAAYLRANPPDVALHVITSFLGIAYLAWFALQKIGTINDEVLACYRY